MKSMQIFNNDEFGKVRTIIIDNEIWFVGKDVAEILGYSNPRKAIGDHIDDEDKGVTKCDTRRYVRQRGRQNQYLNSGD